MFIDYIVALQYNLDNVKENNWSSTLGMLGQLFFLILIFVFILFLTYYSTKWVSTLKFKTRNSKNIKIIESTSVGVQNTIQLIQVGEQFFLIGVTKENITFLSELTGKFDKEENEEQKNKVPFEKYMQEFFDKRKK